MFSKKNFLSPRVFLGTENFQNFDKKQPFNISENQNKFLQPEAF